jgi:elongation factor 3
LLTGELEPNTGTVWKHPGTRVAYVAQHAFHHIEKHLTKSANEYIRWRYQFGEDKEGLEKVTMVISEEEEAKLRQPVQVELMDDAGNIKREKRVIDSLTGVRRSGKNGHEYEVAFAGMANEKNLFMPLEKLELLGFAKHIKIVDTKVEAREGMYSRPLTQDQVEQHLEDVGLDREFGTHNRMAALSGGQKVKVVLAAAMWNQPHIVILDEPTNYLDRDSLGALAGAIREFEGGVVMITHNNEFCSALCPETWVVEHGKLDCRGDPEWMKSVMQEKTTFVQLDEMVDANGNVVKLKQVKKGLSRNEKKVLAKKKAAARERGEVVSSDEEEL